VRGQAARGYKSLVRESVLAPKAAGIPSGIEMLAPGSPADPIQIIDVRDLGAWLVRLVESRVFGAFNACGPDKKLSMGEVLETSKAITKSDAKFTWVSAHFLPKLP